jgi:hypothetical protein
MKGLKLSAQHRAALKANTACPEKTTTSISTYNLSELVVGRALGQLAEQLRRHARRGHREVPKLLVVRGHDLVDQPVGQGLLRGHEVVPVGQQRGSVVRKEL